MFKDVEARLNPELLPKSNLDKIEWKYQLRKFKQLDICEENRTWLLMGPWDQIQEARKCIQLWCSQSLNENNESEFINDSAVRQNDMDDEEEGENGKERPSSFNKKLRSAVNTLLNGEERDSGSESKEDIDEEALKKEMKELEDDFAKVDIKDMDKKTDEVKINRRPKEPRSAVKSLQHREEEDNVFGGKEDSDDDEAFQREINELEKKFANIDTKGPSRNKNNEGMMNGRPEGDGAPKLEEIAANMSKQTNNSREQVISSFWGDTDNKAASLSMVQRDQLDGGASSTVGTSTTSPLLSCTMHNGTKIYLYMADITSLPVGAIVNAANERLQHGGGVALAIANAIGPSFQRDSDAYVKKNGKVPLASVAVQSTNSRIPSRHVINAVGPIWGKFRNKEECKTKLMCTFLQCFKCANEKCKVRSVAVPPISSGERTCNYQPSRKIRKKKPFSIHVSI